MHGHASEDWQKTNVIASLVIVKVQCEERAMGGAVAELGGACSEVEAGWRKLASPSP